jgi:hypothetical protein
LYFSLFVEILGSLGEILGEEVSATLSVSCLGCNFAHEREDCQRFLCSLGKEVSETFLVSCLGCNLLLRQKIAHGLFFRISRHGARNARKERHLREKPRFPPQVSPFLGVRGASRLIARKG